MSGQWISIKDSGLPKIDMPTAFLCVISSKGWGLSIDVLYLYPDVFHLLDDGEVTHYMPLPELPSLEVVR